MIRFRDVACLLVISLPLAPASAQTPLSAVPGDAAVVIRIAGVDALQTAVTEFGDALQEGLGTTLAEEMIANGLGDIVGSQKLEGVDRTKDWYLIVLASGPARPDVALMIPASDPQAVLANLPVSGFSRDGYAIASPTESDLESLLSAAEGDSVLTEIPDLDGFHHAHIAVFVNVDHLVTTYANEIDQARRQINMGLDQLENIQLPANQSPVDMGAVVDMYRSMLDWLDDTLADAEAATVMLDIAGDELVINKRLAFRDGSPSAGELASGTSDLAGALSHLPSGMPVYYAASGAGLSDLMEWGMTFSLSMVSDSDAERIKDLTAQMLNLGFGTISGCMSMPYDDMPIRAVTSIEIADVAGYRELMHEMNAAYAEIDFGMFRQTTTIEAAAETYGDLAADIVTVKQEYSGALGADQERMNRFMFGEDGMVTRVIYGEADVVTSMGGGRELMEAALEAKGDSGSEIGVWTDGALENPSLLILFDLPSFTRQMLFFVDAAAVGGSPIPQEVLDKLAAVEFEESYISSSMSAEGNSLLGRVRIPASQVGPIVQWLTLSEVQQGGGGVQIEAVPAN